jgi:hypothetical protein
MPVDPVADAGFSRAPDKGEAHHAPAERKKAALREERGRELRRQEQLDREARRMEERRQAREDDIRRRERVTQDRTAEMRKGRYIDEVV